eukprot:1072912-Lingulodinium_polyedra.AAC.1
MTRARARALRAPAAVNNGKPPRQSPRKSLRPYKTTAGATRAPTHTNERTRKQTRVNLARAENWRTHGARARLGFARTLDHANRS